VLIDPAARPARRQRPRQSGHRRGQPLQVKKIDLVGHRYRADDSRGYELAERKERHRNALV
jgi:hypothetical protein